MSRNFRHSVLQMGARFGTEGIFPNVEGSVSSSMMNSIDGQVSLGHRRSQQLHFD